MKTASFKVLLLILLLGIQYSSSAQRIQQDTFSLDSINWDIEDTYTPISKPIMDMIRKNQIIDNYHIYQFKNYSFSENFNTQTVLTVEEEAGYLLIYLIHYTNQYELIDHCILAYRGGDGEVSINEKGYFENDSIYIKQTHINDGYTDPPLNKKQTTTFLFLSNGSILKQ